MPIWHTYMFALNGALPVRILRCLSFSRWCLSVAHLDPRFTICRITNPFFPPTSTILSPNYLSVRPVRRLYGNDPTDFTVRSFWHEGIVRVASRHREGDKQRNIANNVIINTQFHSCKVKSRTNKPSLQPVAKTIVEFLLRGTHSKRRNPQQVFLHPTNHPSILLFLASSTSSHNNHTSSTCEVAKESNKSKYGADSR